MGTEVERIALEAPPVRRMLWWKNLPRDERPLPITRAPRLMMTVYMSRWHRPRHGVVIPGGRGMLRIKCWCGSEVGNWSVGHEILTAASVPAGHALCGPCEGKAVGAGQEPTGITPLVRLLFTPSQFEEWRETLNLERAS
jgi:hypothetical protein